MSTNFFSDIERVIKESKLSELSKGVLDKTSMDKTDFPLAKDIANQKGDTNSFSNVGEKNSNSNETQKKDPDSEVDKANETNDAPDEDEKGENTNDTDNESKESEKDNNRDNNEGCSDNREDDNSNETNDASENQENSFLNDTYEKNSYVIIDGEKYRTDDNGHIYSKYNKETNSYENLPNTEYELNGYKYKTDDKGRIVKAEGSLHLTDRENRKTINDNVDGMEEGDEKGHIIGDQFDGSNLSGNLVPQSFEKNRGDYKALELKLKKALEEGKSVDVKIDIQYDKDGKRPTSITVTYTIDGKTSSETFKN